LSDEISLVRILSELVRTPVSELDMVVTRVLGQIAEGAGAEWACLFRLEQGNLASTHSYTAEGVPELDCRADILLGPVMDRLKSGEAIVAEDCRDWTGRGALEAFITLPMREDGVMTSALGVGFASPRSIGVALLDRLKAAADVLGTVLERRQQERAHIATARRLEATLAAMPDLLFEVTHDGFFAEFSAGPERLMLAPHGHLKGRRYSDILPRDVSAVIDRALGLCLETGHVAGIRYSIDLPDGQHWFELTGATKPAEDAADPPTVIFNVRDVTTDTVMRDELTRLGKIVESMSNLVCITDLEENIVWVNAAFERQTGWTLDEIKGRYFADVIRIPGIDPDNEKAVGRAVAARVPHSGQTVNQDRWGNRYWIEYNVIPLQDAAGELVGFVSIETVINRIKEQEAAMALLAQSATEARQRLENAVQALPDGLILLDDQNRVVVANRAYCEMFPELAAHVQAGATLRSVLEKAVEMRLFGPADGTDAERAVWLGNRIATYERPFDADEIQLPDGRWFRRMHTRTTDGGVVALAMDVTARHNQIVALDAANHELRAAEQRLRGILEAADVGMWEWDIAADTLNVRGNWAQMLGREAAEEGTFEMADFLAIVHPDDVTSLPSPQALADAAGDGFTEFEFRMRHEDGHWVWILSRSRVTAWNPDGTPRVMAGVHLDVSERKRLERQLQAGRAYLSEVMDTSITALAVLNERGEITYSNQEAERILGLEGSTLPGWTYNDPRWRLETVKGDPLPEDQLPFRQAQAHGGIVRDIRFALHRQDGTRRVMSANAVPLMPGDGEQHVVVSFSDITEELAATARLEEARARAEEMSKAKSIFLANMSHEIRTPLNGVLGMAEVLDSIVTAPEQKQMVATIRRSGETLLTVLNSILDMSKIEAGKMVLEEVPLVLSDLLSQVEALHRVKAEEKGLELVVLTSAGADLPRIGDPHRLIQVLNNLLSNAIKFTEHGHVRLKVSCRAGKPITFDVTDTGVGMTEHQMARVFESFEQADGSMTRRFGGTGLGLSIVRQLVQLMNGTITMQSSAGAGTTVRVVLPLPESEAGVPAPSEADDRPPDLSLLEGRKILIADDNFTNRLVLSEMLGQTGMDLTLVENGQEALSLWQEELARGAPFDLLLLDITMPVLDGLGALSAIRQAERTAGRSCVPAIAVTANAMPNQVADYIVGGFDTHLSKPFKRKELLHAVHSLLRP